MQSIPLQVVIPPDLLATIIRDQLPDLIRDAIRDQLPDLVRDNMPRVGMGTLQDAIAEYVTEAMPDMIERHISGWVDSNPDAIARTLRDNDDLLDTSDLLEQMADALRDAAASLS